MPEPTLLTCLQEGQRVDAYLAAQRQDLSRAHIQRLIREGHVRVNGAVVKPSARMLAGDRISLYVPDPLPSAVAPEPLPLVVVYEDSHVVVVDKPPGLTVHPAPGHPTGTLVNALLARYPEIAGVGGSARPGIVHRLDAGTSGLMVVARSPLAYLSLVRQIKERSVTKVYLALVRGHPAPLAGVIEAPIGRSTRDRLRMAVVAGGREAVTEYRTLRQYKGFTFLEVRLHTGRTHQIRVHLSAMGHPVAGDPQYGGRTPFLKRQFLHAHRLGFQHPATGESLELTSPLPEDLERALEGLESEEP
ncbi:MAG: RluA family pseudouridine synthase [Chloroflexi bacterium]|nr:RluA family pseudouridine synthase [Chloroflexota bacterium]